MHKISKSVIVAIAVGSVAFCMMLIGIMQNGKVPLSGQFCESPEEAFQTEFSVAPVLAITCGEHVHLIGNVKRHSYDSEKTSISAVASMSESGQWFISELQERAPVIRASTDPWQSEWSVFFALQQANCHRSVIGIDIVVRDELNAEQIGLLLEKATDSEGTQFYICGEYHTELGQGLYTIYGLADVSQAGYSVFYNGELIYP